MKLLKEEGNVDVPRWYQLHENSKRSRDSFPGVLEQEIYEIVISHGFEENEFLSTNNN